MGKNILKFVREDLGEIRQYPFGPDYTRGMIKLSSNEIPYPPPESVLKAISEVFPIVNRYPAVNVKPLILKIAQYVGTDASRIMIGSGSSELIDIAVKTFLSESEEAIISIPTFEMYEIYTVLAKGKPKFVKMKKGFQWDIEGIINSISPKTKIVFICSPNNPTGNTIPLDDLLRIAEKDVVVIVDEAYGEFAERSVVSLVKESSNIIVLRTFSKAFGLAGLRIGYLIADPELVSMMERVKPPFDVNAVALKAAETALDELEYVRKVVDQIREGRRYLYSELRRIRGIKVYPSEANFILINVARTRFASIDVTKRLEEKGILVRDCTGVRGMGSGFIRITVGTMDENRALIKALKEVIG